MEQRRFHRRGWDLPPGVGHHEAGLVEQGDGFVRPTCKDRMATAPCWAASRLDAERICSPACSSMRMAGMVRQAVRRARGIQRVGLQACGREQEGPISWRLLRLRTASSVFVAVSASMPRAEKWRQSFRLERRGAEDECVDGLGRRGRQLRGRSGVGLGAQRDGEREGLCRRWVRIPPRFRHASFRRAGGRCTGRAGPAVAARGGGVNLPERLEDWPRNSRRDPAARVSRTKQMICTRRCSGQVSEGSSSAWPCLSVTQICPPGPVNFTALVTRFMMICWRRPASPISAICMFGSMSTTSSMPPAWALCRATVQTWCTTSSSMNRACSSSRCPASIFDTSSRSLMISSAREDWRMARR